MIVDPAQDLAKLITLADVAPLDASIGNAAPQLALLHTRSRVRLDYAPRAN